MVSILIWKSTSVQFSFLSHLYWPALVLQWDEHGVVAGKGLKEQEDRNIELLKIVQGLRKMFVFRGDNPERAGLRAVCHTVCSHLAKRFWTSMFSASLGLVQVARAQEGSSRGSNRSSILAWGQCWTGQTGMAQTDKWRNWGQLCTNCH